MAEFQPKNVRARAAVTAIVMLMCACFRTEPDRPERRPPLESQPTGNCLLDDRGGVCTAGGCTLVVPPDALEELTAIEVGRVPVPVELATDVLGDIACELRPSSLRFAVPGRFTLEVGAAPSGFEPEDAVAVFLDNGIPSLAPDTQVLPSGSAVALGVEGSRTVAVTYLARDIRPVREISAQLQTLDGVSGRLRALSSRRFVAVTADAERIYLGAGDRVLVYRGRSLPVAPALPDLVLGAPDLLTEGLEASAAAFGGDVNGLWSDGQRLAVATGNRVLIWNRIPEASFAPADLVLGQGDFRSNAANRGRPSPAADTLWAPNQIASDGRRFAVADSQNHRVLVWEGFPRFVGQPADVVLGQADFDERGISAGAIPMYQARGVAFAPGLTLVTSTFGSNCAFGVTGSLRSNPAPETCLGTRRAATRVAPLELSQPGALGLTVNGLVVRDFVGRRLSVWNTIPRSPRPPDFVIGKPAADVGGSDVGGLNASALADGNVFAGLYTSDELWLVPDEHRVLVFDPPPTYGFAPAPRVFGQASFSVRTRAVDYGRVDANSLARPGGVATEAGVLAVADTANDRVLVRTGNRTVVLGQPDATSFGANRFGDVSAETLSGPEAVLLQNGQLFVADTQNHRVLIWRSVPTRDGQPADAVLGQPNLRSRTPNHGLGGRDGVLQADGQGFFHPSALAFTNGTLFVADTFNHRVLGFRLPETTANLVLGQADVRGRAPNRGQGLLQPSERGLAAPAGLSVSPAGDLFVADTENNRILAFDPRDFDLAPAVFGQDDLTSQRAPNFAPNAPGVPVSPAQKIVRADSFHRPRGMAWIEDRLYVADTGNHRVLRYQLRSGELVDAIVYGQSDATSNAVNAFGPSGRSLSAPTDLAVDREGTLLVADRDNHRVLALGPNPEASGTVALGQSDSLENGFNRSLGDRADLADPSSVVVTGETVWVSDRSRNRVLGFRDGAPEVILGQDNLTRILPNGGGAPAAKTLAGPTTLATDGRRLVVADTDNHRVLVWNELPTTNAAPASLVLGQANFQSGAPNRGQDLRAGPSSLRSPRGVFLEGERLWVTDAGNNRALLFDLASAEPGIAASVLCQPNLQSNLPNRGQAGASATSCYAPEGVAALGDQLFVADTLNDRVLIFPREGEPGRAATAVLGQPNLQSRIVGEVGPDTVSGPRQLTVDGVNLYVTDTGHNRVLVYLASALEAGPRQVIGQPDFDVDLPRRGEGLRTPSGVFATAFSFIESRVWVADTGNGRVVELAGLRR